MIMAIMPPTPRKNRPARKYRVPILLWSVLVIHSASHGAKLSQSKESGSFL